MLSAAKHLRRSRKVVDLGNARAVGMRGGRSFAALRMTCGAQAVAVWLISSLLFGWSVAGAEKPAVPSEEIVRGLRSLATTVFEQAAPERSEMVREDLRRRLAAANERSTSEWRSVRTRADWERLRADKLQLLRKSLGEFLTGPGVPLVVHVSSVRTGDGYRNENLVFESRSGIWVTANLYTPAPPLESMPGILICHSHHRPKEQGELQDMGMTWARHGCLVLVMDQLGHGERAQHPFKTSADFPGDFRPERQDYYFRYDWGVQLHLVGESLIGWMVGDLMRGVDLLLARPGVDPSRILLLGAVAGGGDPAAVTGALDERIAAVVPFNFGGPEPENVFPLPPESERTFNYAGSGSWESTRNLRRSASDGFLPWVIVASTAPRRLIYAHEFSWDQERDPVWQRLHVVFGFYGGAERLDWVRGRGSVRGRPPEATHCTNIGAVHRERIHAAFASWFGINARSTTEYSSRLEPGELRCMTDQLRAQLQPAGVTEVLTRIGRARLVAARDELAGLPAAARRSRLRDRWTDRLGDAEPSAPRPAETRGQESLGPVTVLRQTVEVEPGITLPFLLLVPPTTGGKRLPLVVGLAQEGKQAFLRQRGEAIGDLLAGQVAVCLPDLRGTGETGVPNARGPFDADTSLASTELMLGGTLVGARLRDLRSLLWTLWNRSDIDRERTALWGDSFTPFTLASTSSTTRRMPHRVEGRPAPSEPLGGLVALLGALFEDDVKAVYVHRGLISFESVLGNPFIYIPGDVVVPGLASAGDLCDLAAALAPRPLALISLTEAWEQPVPLASVRSTYSLATQTYRDAGSPAACTLDDSHAVPPARWLLARLTTDSAR